jgi:hypothetical protein
MTLLPPAALERLNALRVQEQVAADGARACGARLHMLGAADGGGLRERLEDELQRQSSRAGALGQLVNRCLQFLSELPAGVALELAGEVDLASPPDAKAAIAAVRIEIAALQTRLQATRRAPLPRADQMELAMQYVAGLIGRCRPTIAIVGDKLAVNFKADMLAPEDILGLAVWAAGPEPLLGAIERELERVPVRADAISASSRSKIVAEIAAQILAAEMREEKLIEIAAAGGVEVLRRPNADVRAVLGLVIAQAVKQVA